MSTVTQQSENDNPAPTRLLISANSATAQFLGTCPHATTLFAWSMERASYVLCSLTCRRWGCSYCGRRKITAMAARTREAAPNRLITLTVDVKRFLSPRDAYDQTRRKVSDLTKQLNKKLGSFEYFRVLEATKKGWPHYHFVARCPFISQAWLSDAWAKLTGAPIVDVRAIGKATDAYWYVVKYLAKQTHVPWTNRRVSWSRKFFPPRDRSKDVTLRLTDKARYVTHPAEFCNRELEGQTLVALTAGCWEIDSSTGVADPNEKQVRQREHEARQREKKDRH